MTSFKTAPGEGCCCDEASSSSSGSSSSSSGCQCNDPATVTFHFADGSNYVVDKVSGGSGCKYHEVFNSFSCSYFFNTYTRLTLTFDPTSGSNPTVEYFDGTSTLTIEVSATGDICGKKKWFGVGIFPFGSPFPSDDCDDMWNDPSGSWYIEITYGS